MKDGVFVSTIYCKYHPSAPARWYCPQCQIDFCHTCVPHGGGRFTLCPICQSPVQSIGLGNAITPFWLRLPRVFAYPLHFAPLVYMLVLSCLGALAGYATLKALLLQLLFLSCSVVMPMRRWKVRLKGWLILRRLRLNW